MAFAPEPPVPCCLPRTRAELVSGGVTGGRLSGPTWRRPVRGRYVPDATGRLDGQLVPAQRILDVLPLLHDGDAVSGWAAAYLHGVAYADGLDAAGRPRPVQVRRTRGSRDGNAAVRFVRSERPGRTSAAALTYTDHVTGAVQRLEVPTAGAAESVLLELRGCRDLARAVAVVDAAAHTRWLGRRDVNTLLTERFTDRGTRMLRHALALSDPAARSPWESRLRVFCTVDCRLPMPLVNPRVYDRYGRLLGLPDLLWPEIGLVVEYDGAYHGDRFQHREDNVREELFERAGLVVARVDALDMTRHRNDVHTRLTTTYRTAELTRDRRQTWTLLGPEDDVDDPVPYLLTEAERAELYASLEPRAS